MVLALSRVLPSADGSWLAADNAYKSGAEARIKSDGNVVSPAAVSDFTEYVAASAFVHCGDGWGYLGRAADAILKGDIHAAVHLTYYSELRASMSLLAAQGIYIGNNRHFALTSAGGVERLSTEGTHSATWAIFDAWRESPGAASLFSRLVKVGGEALAEWYSGLAGVGIAAVLDDLLRRLALDLQTFSADRNRRNAASYRPTWLRAETLSAQEAADMVAGVWDVMEPDAPGSFPVLDRILLGEVLRDAYASVNGVVDENGSPLLAVDWSDWEVWIGAQIPAIASGTALEVFLKELPKAATGSDPVSQALGNAAPPVGSLGDNVAAMLGRAAVLLRFATGACIELADDAGVSALDIAPWTLCLGAARGYWNDADTPEEMLDLWADVADALEAFGDRPVQGALRTLHDRLGRSAVTLGQGERVVVWSFA